MINDDEYFMQLALQEAQVAFRIQRNMLEYYVANNKLYVKLIMK
jgi:hypothetical protein